VERPGRVVRFARLIHRPGGVLGGPAVRPACGNLNLPWRRRVGWRFTASTLRVPASRKPRWRLVTMPGVADGRTLD